MFLKAYCFIFSVFLFLSGRAVFAQNNSYTWFFMSFFWRNRPRFFGASGKCSVYFRANCVCPTSKNKKAPRSLASGVCLCVFQFLARSFLSGSLFEAPLSPKINLKHRKWTWIVFRVSDRLPGNFQHFLGNPGGWL